MHLPVGVFVLLYLVIDELYYASIIDGGFFIVCITCDICCCEPICYKKLQIWLYRLCILYLSYYFFLVPGDTAYIRKYFPFL